MSKLKLARKEKLLFVTPLLVLVLPVIAALRSTLYQDKLDVVLKKLSEPSSIDCGYVSLHASQTPLRTMHSCTVKAFTDRKPFHARSERDASGNPVSHGLVGRQDGKIYFLVEKKRSRYRSYVEVWLCSKPKVDTAPGPNGLQTLGLYNDMVGLPDIE